jgi:hypothetical protein
MKQNTKGEEEGETSPPSNPDVVTAHTIVHHHHRSTLPSIAC